MEETVAVEINRYNNLPKLAKGVFLVLCIYHGLNGLWIILQDYVRKDGFRILIFGALIIVSLFLLSLGMLTIVPFSPGT